MSPRRSDREVKAREIYEGEVLLPSSSASPIVNPRTKIKPTKAAYKKRKKQHEGLENEKNKSKNKH